MDNLSSITSGPSGTFPVGQSPVCSGAWGLFLPMCRTLRSPFFNLMEAPVGPILLIIQMPHNASTTFWFTSLSSWRCVI